MCSHVLNCFLLDRNEFKPYPFRKYFSFCSRFLHISVFLIQVTTKINNGTDEDVICMRGDSGHYQDHFVPFEKETVLNVCKVTPLAHGMLLNNNTKIFSDSLKGDQNAMTVLSISLRHDNRI